ncbi:MAG TPA: hypothetical protein VH601_21535 [Bryobacteraceae bacterium]|jgi:hypothetical protein
MDPSVETFLPSRLYSRVGWAALAGALVCVLCGFRAPLAFIPGVLCAITSAGLFWLAARPAIEVGEDQFNIGDRAIAWREVREVNRSRFLSPLVIKLKLTNSRRKVVIFPGEPDRIERLMFQLRKNSQFATFDGVAYRDYWTWVSLSGARGDTSTLDQPVRMLSSDDEEEIERLYQKLKSVGRLDSRGTDPSEGSDKD